MHKQYVKYYSHNLGRDTDMLVYGHWGYPVLLFPTTLGNYYQATEMGLINAVAPLIQSGKYKIYCIGTNDEESWYCNHIHPAEKINNHIRYDQFLSSELLPFIQNECNVEKIGVAGCSFGGYHAANFAFKHPYLVAYLISMSGIFDLKSFMKGYYDDNFYFNNPADFMQNEQGWRYNHMNIILGTSELDICLEQNIEMSSTLNRLGVEHWLDIHGNEEHDWPLWQRMFHYYLSRIL